MYAVLFDIDGTLIDTGGAGRAAMYAGFQAEFQIETIVDGIPFTGRTDPAIAADLLATHTLAADSKNVRRCLDAYLRFLPAKLTAHSHGRVLPGIESLVRELAGRADVSMGLLTGNMREGAHTKLRHYGLADYFGFGGFGDEHFERDDVARDAVTVLSRRVGRHIDPRRIFVIGDTPLDVGCARAVGATAVAVKTGWSSHSELAAAEPDLLVDDLADPAPLLNLLTTP